jgi:hypothetical protein
VRPFEFPSFAHLQDNPQGVWLTGYIAMLARICSDEVIAGTLNRNGLLTGRGNRSANLLV